MANVPFPISGETLDEFRVQVRELIRQVFEEKIGGADLGDVFAIVGDVLTLVLADLSGLTKDGNKLAVEAHSTGGLQVVADGVRVKLADATLTADASGLYVTTPAPLGPAVTVESEETFGIANAVGIGLRYARNDHTHGSPRHPTAIGGIYLNVTGVNPNTELGYGTWVQVAKGNYLVGEV